LQTNDFIIYDLSETLLKNKIRVFRNPYILGEIMDYVLTIGDGLKSHPEDDHVVLLAFNKKTLEIKRLYTDPEFTVRNDMYQLLNDKLYILNAKNDLLIFERTEQVT